MPRPDAPAAASARPGSSRAPAPGARRRRPCARSWCRPQPAARGDASGALSCAHHRTFGHRPCPPAARRWTHPVDACTVGGEPGPHLLELIMPRSRRTTRLSPWALAALGALGLVALAGSVLIAAVDVPPERRAIAILAHGLVV